MNKVIVTTTIGSPNESVETFDNLDGWHLVVVGDKKTPSDYKLRNGTYLSPDDQDRIDRELSEAIGWNCIQRRNFGFILAHEMGADVVATIDDDNIPLPGWGQDLLVNKDVVVTLYSTDLPVFDPVGATNYRHLWHRGYPLQLLPLRDYSRANQVTIRPAVQADFWNGDPDVDAICRLEHAPDCEFDPDAFPLSSDVMAPFDSQNTFLDARLLPNYFMLPGVGRMDDIWPAYYVQALGAKVVFNAPSVIQKRHEHDLIVDMKGEYPGYENNLQLVNALQEDPNSLFKFLPERTVTAFRLYQRHFK
jgi:hypothetical protein